MTDMETMSKEIDCIKAMLADINCDTDALLEHKEETKMDDAAIIAMLQNKGIDPGLIAMLKDDNNGLGGGGAWWIIILFLFLLGNGNGFGLGGNNAGTGVEAVINGQTQYTSIIDALNGNRSAIGDLAVSTGSSFGQVQNAICGMRNELTNIGGKVDYSEASVKNAIQNCCCTLQNAINTQACETRQSISALGYNMQAQFAAQTNQFQTLYAQLSTQMSDGFCQVRERELEAEVQRLRDINSAARDAANTQLILTSLAAKDSVSGTLNTTAGTWQGNIS